MQKSGVVRGVVIHQRSLALNMLLLLGVSAACNRNDLAPRTAKRFEGQTIPPSSLFLHGGPETANPATLWLDQAAPSATSARYQDSSAVNFNDGNPWKVIGTWESSAEIMRGNLTAASGGGASDLLKTCAGAVPVTC